jgi:predicted DNA-binding protein
MQTTITIRIDSELNSILTNKSQSTGKSKSDLILEAVKRQLAVESFQQLQKKIIPFAKNEGFDSEEDIMQHIS